MLHNANHLLQPQPLDFTGVRPQRGVGVFFRTSACFLLGLFLTLWCCDRLIGAHLRRQAMRPRGSEVLRATIRARSGNGAVRAIYLGDSVARQLFTPGTEPAPDVKFLATNQAMSLAGQCYLLEESLAANPHLQDVYLLYIPGCFSNNLPVDLSRDYLCAYFHRPDQVAEVFAVKHDVRLTAAHIGRMLLPNLMIENSALDPSAGPAASPPSIRPATAAFVAQPSAGREPLFSVLELIWKRPPESPPPVAGSYGADLSPVSRYFLNKMRGLCAAHRVKLHVLPCPLSTAETFSDPCHVYDAAPLRVDPKLLVDAVHFRAPYVQEYRRRVVEAYALDRAAR